MEVTQKLMNDIHQWADKTFGEDRTATRALKHLKKEAQEAVDAIYLEEWNDTPQRTQASREELADCFILVLNAASKYGMTFEELFHEGIRKMEINKLRKWGEPDEHGVVEHIRD